MPSKSTLERARKDAREGKSASTQAGEFVREEVHHVREGKHGARSAKQAHRHRSLQGSPGWRQTEAAGRRQNFGRHPEESATGPRQGLLIHTQTAVAQAIPCHHQGAQARRPPGRVFRISVPSGALLRQAAQECASEIANYLLFPKAGALSALPHLFVPPSSVR